MPNLTACAAAPPSPPATIQSPVRRRAVIIGGRRFGYIRRVGEGWQSTKPDGSLLSLWTGQDAFFRAQDELIEKQI